MDVPVRAAVEKAAADGFQFLDRGRGLFHQSQGQILIIDVLAALERIHEVFFMGIAGVKHHIEAALNHAAASALAFQRLGGDEDVQVRVCVMSVNGGQLRRRAHAQHQQIHFVVRIHKIYPCKTLRQLRCLESAKMVPA